MPRFYGLVRRLVWATNENVRFGAECLCVAGESWTIGNFVLRRAPVFRGDDVNAIATRHKSLHRSRPHIEAYGNSSQYWKDLRVV